MGTKNQTKHGLLADTKDYSIHSLTRFKKVSLDWVYQALDGHLPQIVLLR